MTPILVALFFLQGAFCPAVCTADAEEHTPAAEMASSAPTGTSPCHGSPPATPKPQESRADCAHCEAPALTATAHDAPADAPATSILADTPAPWSRIVVAVHGPKPLVSDPPPTNRLLQKSTLLL